MACKAKRTFEAYIDDCRQQVTSEQVIMLAAGGATVRVEGLDWYGAIIMVNKRRGGLCTVHKTRAQRIWVRKARALAHEYEIAAADRGVARKAEWPVWLKTGLARDLHRMSAGTPGPHQRRSER